MLVIAIAAICWHAIMLWSVVGDDVKEIKHVVYIVAWTQIQNVLGYAL